jgi:FAD binding domain/Berberine and berberine like
VKRIDFLKVTSLAAIGWAINGCQNNDATNNNKSKIKNSAAKKKSDIDSTIIDSSKLTSQPISKHPNVLTAKDTRYDTLRQSYNKRINKRPIGIIECASTQEVADAIRYALAERKTVTPKSGGHSFEGFNMNNDSLLLHLGNLNSIKRIGKNSIRVGPAATLKSLFNFLSTSNQILPSGSCSSVGIGGLTLGGGYGFFSRQMGLTCDSLTRVTMVDGQGNILDSKNDSEILWGCKGGNNGHFGIVTEMDFTTHRVPNYFQVLQYSTSKVHDDVLVKEIFQKYIQLGKQLNRTSFAAFFLRKGFCGIRIFQFGSNNIPVIESVLGDLKLTTKINKKISAISAMARSYGSAKPLHFKNSSCGYFNEYLDVQTAFEKAYPTIISSSNVLFQVNTLGGAISDASNTGAYAHRSFQYLTELQTYWNTPSEEKMMIEKFSKILGFYDELKSIAQYVNYPAVEFKQPGLSYYGASLPRLQALKKKYDAQNTIFTQQGLD